ncbi:oxidoreductase [Chryseobacterium lactis]|uniref:Oxidoreductase n=1 Tax=Chryseobacterium lactis TaxID=1241981 RepID=A0A3G6RIB4_CHRLC|nr:NADP-dependent oxidoreductase [Chryseobacterium lactis]AZA83573.1 NADP-dependent oxidoreductase [Chryseobacterium lactis]AZB03958.1 NADP-dependent oxidoreductase [Chryseobacterium lactis]PNW13133.1 oxidoreductase [Chryseobacterium lactis]
MKAYLLYEAGGPDKLVLGEAQKPILKSGEVLIKVKAIGINPADTLYRNSNTFITAMFGEERPAIIGWDISGEIVEKAQNTDGFEMDDAVFALLQNARGYAEFVAVNIELLARKSGNISFEEAAAAPMAGLTAWQPLVHGMNIKKGDKILIHGASGGVGHFAVQIAKYFGAEVIATSSAKNRDFVLSLGADKHIDYQTENFWDKVKDVDFVFDTIGGETLAHSIDVTKPGGTIISILGLANDDLKMEAESKKVKLSLWGMQCNGDDLRALADLMSKGIIKPHIAETYPFTSMAEAHLQVETRRTAGKIVVTL